MFSKRKIILSILFMLSIIFVLLVINGNQQDELEDNILVINTAPEEAGEIITVKDEKIEENNYIKLQVNSDGNWEFIEWQGEHAEDITKREDYKSVQQKVPITVMPLEYTLDVGKTGKGDFVLDEGRYTFVKGEKVELEAISDYGWEFKQGKGDVSNTDTKKITAIMNEDKSIEALLEEEIPDNSALQRGDRGQKVEEAQQIFWDLGYNINIDGIFGEGTEEIVSAFQKSFDLKADGIIGEQTWQLIERMDASKVYQVKPGDSLYKIAKNYNIDIELIKAINDLEGNYLNVGQELKLPRANVGGDEASDLENAKEYEVQRGDTISDIAINFNTDVESIKRLNNLKSFNIQSGQTLEITTSDGKRQTSIELKEGLLPWPVEGPKTSGYGWRDHPITGKRQFHGGIDIAAPTGTPVKAVAMGVVVGSDLRGGFGKTIVIDHGQEIKTLYAHNSRLLIREGAQVEKGQIISLVGSTGQSTGPHVDFRIYINDERVNPLNYLE